MIHLDYADGTSAWLTDEQLKERHPEIYAKLREPAPHKEYGEKLKRIRQGNNVSIREMAKLTNCKASYLCSVELGKIEAPMDLIDEYGRLHLTLREGNL